MHVPINIHGSGRYKTLHFCSDNRRIVAWCGVKWEPNITDKMVTNVLRNICSILVHPHFLLTQTACGRVSILPAVNALSIESPGNRLNKPTIQLNQLALIELVFPSGLLSTERSIIEHVFLDWRAAELGRITSYTAHSSILAVYIYNTLQYVRTCTYCYYII